MKRLFVLMLACAALMVACEPKEPENPGDGPNTPENPEPQNPVKETYNSITATLAGATMKAAWEDGDAIQVYNVTADGNDVEAKYVLSAGAGTATGTFVPDSGSAALEKGGKGYFAAYPYDPDMTFAQHNTFSSAVPAERAGMAPMFAYADDAASLSFSSFMGAVKFTLTGKGNIGSLSLDDANTNNILSGNVTINPKSNKVTFKNGSSSKNSISYKFPSKLELNESTSPEIVLEIPAGCLAQGGSLTLIDMNNAPLAMVEIPGATVEAGKVANLGNIQFKGQSQTIDLSAAGTANCYIIPDTGNYKFKAVKGNSSEAVAAASVEVFWETWNETAGKDDIPAVEVTPNSVVASVSLEDGYVMVSMADPVHPGNALIAAKDAEGNIIWSWHLWVPETPIETVADPDKYFWNTPLMDRNLGALVVTDTTSVVSIKSYGLSYQWGRVTPLVGLHFSVSGTGIKSAEGAFDMDYWIAHPEEISSGVNNNWLPTTVTDLWDNNGEKTIYDPCPPGYRVPPYDSSMPLWKTANRGGNDDDWVFNNEQRWFYNKTIKIIFPIGGYLDGGAAKLTKEDRRTCIWSANPGDGDISNESAEVHVRGSAAFVDISRDSGKYYYKSYFKYAGATVRCAVEH